jgi:hypothetical protein
VLCVIPRRKTIVVSLAAAFAVLVLACCAGLRVFSWYKFSTLTWVTPDGGVCLRYHPGKGIIDIRVDADYQGGGITAWHLTCADSLWERWRAGRMPPPSELFRRGHFSSGRSDPLALTRLYDHVSAYKKRQIAQYLEDSAERTSQLRWELQRLYLSGDYPWLSRVLDPGENPDLAWQDVRAPDE